MGQVSRWLRGGRHSATLLLGIVNGLLPCGLVYAAVLAAIGFGRLDQGVLFLLAFGAGTVPLLAAGAASIATVTHRTRTFGRHGTTIALGLIGGLLIARGLAWPHAHDVPADAPAADEAHLHQ
jgi:sulfite exporter TauE/SafE